MGDAAVAEVEGAWQRMRARMAPINCAVFERLGDRVLCGPFRGMRLIRDVSWNDGNIGNKLIGAYEFELHAAIKKALSRKPQTVINVGCAEGWYAVGLAMLLPKAMIYAMDMNEYCLKDCETNARNNHVRNLITVAGKVGPEDLQRGEGEKLYVVDIEGYELSVLNPYGCPDLLVSDMIVECHDFFQPENPISKLLTERFSLSHEIDRISPQQPRPGDYAFLNFLSDADRYLTITEKRPAQTTWLACWAKQRSKLNG